VSKPITITVPTDQPGELAYFSLIPMTSFEEFMENVRLLVKPTDVVLGENMGWWTIVE